MQCAITWEGNRDSDILLDKLKYNPLGTEARIFPQEGGWGGWGAVHRAPGDPGPSQEHLKVRLEMREATTHWNSPAAAEARGWPLGYLSSSFELIWTVSLGYISLKMLTVNLFQCVWRIFIPNLLSLQFHGWTLFFYQEVKQGCHWAPWLPKSWGSSTSWWPVCIREGEEEGVGVGGGGVPKARGGAFHCTLSLEPNFLRSLWTKTEQLAEC